MKNRYFKWKYGWVVLLVAAICACSENNELAQMVNKQEQQSETRTANLRTETIELVEIETLETKLTEVMGEEDVSNLEKLIVSGPMSAKDFNYLQNNLIGLHVLDMSNARIVTSDEYYWSPYRGSVKLKNDTICEGMFYNFDNLSDVVLPSSILYIDECAFAYCDTLTSVVIPETVKILNARLFEDCNYLSSVTLPSGLEGIGRSVFHSCDSLKTIEIPENVKSIGDNAFSNCTSLSSVTLSSRLEALESGAFAYCNSLKSIVIPDKVKYIGENAFAGNEIFSEIEFSSSSELDSIANWAFQNSNLKSITIPDGVNYIGEYVFYSCDSLATVTLPSSLTYLGSYAFNWCISLETIDIPDGVKQINDGTFYDCRSLKSIKLPSNLEAIGTYGITASLIESLELPSTLKTISSYAFEHNDYLKKVVVPEGVETIGTQAFRYNQGLKELTIPSTVTSVDQEFAHYCHQLQILNWNAPIDVPYNYGTFNCFLYIETDQEITWDDSWSNVIKNGVAQSTITILANADNEFKILKGFTAPEVVYTRYFSGRTAPGKSSGWQTIVLPFTPDSIYHETKGRIAPFNSGIEDTKPFWLRELTADGFSDVTTMTPDKAYIIAMPNSDSYLEDYRLEGNITFTAKNVAIAKTPDTLTVSQGPEFDFYPSYKYVKKALYVYSLTSQYTYDGNINSYFDHSYFERSRDHVYPFNAYVSTKGGGRSSRSTFEIDGRSKNTRSADQPNKTGIPQIGDM